MSSSLGPSGCGKTARAACRLRTIPTTCRRCRRRQRQGHHQGARQQARRRHGVPGAASSRTSARDNVSSTACACAGKSLPPTPFPRQRLLEARRPAEHRRSLPHQLSVGINSAIALAPCAGKDDVLLLDEHLLGAGRQGAGEPAGRDPPAADRAGRDDVVRHDQEEALSMADRVAVLRARSRRTGRYPDRTLRTARHPVRRSSSAR